MRFQDPCRPRLHSLSWASVAVYEKTAVCEHFSWRLQLVSVVLTHLSCFWQGCTSTQFSEHPFLWVRGQAQTLKHVEDVLWAPTAATGAAVQGEKGGSTASQPAQPDKITQPLCAQCARVQSCRGCSRERDSFANPASNAATNNTAVASGSHGHASA